MIIKSLKIFIIYIIILICFNYLYNKIITRDNTTHSTRYELLNTIDTNEDK
jgi:hypothetical protein